MSDAQAKRSVPRPNLLLLGASSLNSQVALTQLVGAMLESKGIQMNIEEKWRQLDQGGAGYQDRLPGEG